MKDERMLEVPIPILYRIVQNYYSNNDKNNSYDDFVDFCSKYLIKIVLKHRYF